MKLSRRRAARIQNELRLWLREKFGMRSTYSKSEIDLARQKLGFDDVDDALVAYTFFGPDLVPGLLASGETSVSAPELADIIDALEIGIDGGADLFVDDGI
ncbi:MAG: hypothetical protein ACR2Q3_04450 [Woeseiaceae bacterium]